MNQFAEYCPTCDSRLTALGKAVKGVWMETGAYRCSVCPSGSNRFKLAGGALTPDTATPTARPERREVLYV